MNKESLLAEINLSDPTLAKLAQLALFARIQSVFNLHPREVGEELAKIAASQHEDLATTVERLLPETQKVFRARFSQAQALLSEGRVSAETFHESPVTDYFGIRPRTISVFIRNGLKETGMNSEEVIDGERTRGQQVAMEFSNITQKMLPWVFEEAMRIHSRLES